MKYRFGEKLRKLRKERNLTTRALSKKAKIPYDTLVALELNKSKDPKITTIIKLAKFFKMSIDDMLKGVEFK